MLLCYCVTVSQVSLEGSTFDTILGVYKGKTLGALVLLVSNDDRPDGPDGRVVWSRVTFTSVPGVEYFIQVRTRGRAMTQ